MKHNFLRFLLGPLVLTTAIAATAPQATAQPFGIAMGTPMSALDLGKPRSSTGPSYYDLLSVPKSHSSFNTFIVEALPAVGVCGLTAISPAFTNDPSGAKVLSTFDTVKNQLLAKYGTPFEDDSEKAPPATQDGVLLNPQDLVRATIWFSRPEKPLPDNVLIIYLVLAVLEAEGIHVGGSYTFDNHDDCPDSWRSRTASDKDAL